MANTRAGTSNTPTSIGFGRLGRSGICERSRRKPISDSVTGLPAGSGVAGPRGRSTASEWRFCKDSDASMKVASRKNITSIIGMISMRPRRRLRGLRSFIFPPHRVEADVVDNARAEPLHLIQDFGLAVRGEVEGEQRHERDEETQRRRPARLGH